MTIAISINTMNEQFRSDMDRASSIAERVTTLKTLFEYGFHTVVFISPIFPYITDFRNIIERTSRYVSEFWFENLNLRGDYKREILSYIESKYPQCLSEYHDIYNLYDMNYWLHLSDEINVYCEEKHIHYTNYFYHDLLVAQKKQKR